MNFLRKLAGLFSGSGGGASARQFKIYVLSHRCNEPLEGQVDLFNELSQTEDDSAHGYFTRKVLHTSGENRCFDQVEVSIWFDNNKKLAEYEVERGRWLSEEEYHAELARFHAPPPEEELAQADQPHEEVTPSMTPASESDTPPTARIGGEQDSDEATPPDPSR